MLLNVQLKNVRNKFSVIMHMYTQTVSKHTVTRMNVVPNTFVYPTVRLYVPDSLKLVSTELFSKPA